MRLFLAGSGEVTGRLNTLLTQRGYGIEAQMARFSAQALDMLDIDGIVVVSPEATAPPDQLQRAVERGRLVVVIGGADDPVASWARAINLPTLAYPPNEMEVQRLLDILEQARQGRGSAADAYRRAALGSDLTARTQAAMATRRVVLTSPKGGVGKTTLAVNLAVLMALCGIDVYLVDADANQGAVHHHLRLRQVKTTLPRLLRRFEQPSNGSGTALAGVAAGGRILEAFTPMPDLPTLHVLPGFLNLADLSDPVLQDEARLRAFFARLYEVGTAANGVVLVDVGINPAHPVHRAALAGAESISLVAKPEIPDLGHTRQWLVGIVRSLMDHERVSRDQALAFVTTRVKLVFNWVYGKGWQDVRRALEEALRKEDHLPLQLTPQAVVPMVPPDFAVPAVNSENPTDILVWRYKRRREAELEAFTRAMVDLATHFIPTIPEAAARVGLLPAAKKKRGLAFWRKKA